MILMDETNKEIDINELKYLYYTPIKHKTIIKISLENCDNSLWFTLGEKHQHPYKESL